MLRWGDGAEMGRSLQAVTRLIAGLTDNEWHIIGNRPAVSGREIVEHDDAFSLLSVRGGSPVKEQAARQTAPCMRSARNSKGQTERADGVISGISAGAISSRRSSAPSCLSLHVLAQRSIDTCLIALIGGRMILEPGDHVGVDAKCQLLLDGPIEEATLGTGPVGELGRV